MSLNPNLVLMNLAQVIEQSINNLWLVKKLAAGFSSTLKRSIIRLAKFALNFQYSQYIKVKS